MLQKYSKQLAGKLGLEFPVLCDPDNKVADKFGKVFSVDPALLELYIQFGIDLKRFNNDKNGQLALPGRVIIDGNGIVHDSEFHPDHTTRPEPEETLAKLKRLTS